MTVLPLGSLAVALALLSSATAFAQQQLYRWTDENGRTHVTDTPPPPSAKNVQKKTAAAGGGSAAPLPFELTLAMKDFPVVLYSAPACRQPCGDARALLNKRGIPFREVAVWDQDSGAELSRVSGGTTIPTLLVGATAQRGFNADAYNALLDSARYPKSGVAPVRSQAAPALPKDYAEAMDEVTKAEAIKREAEQQPKGPYAPGSQSQRPDPAQK
jgi:glutaredoxin